jgi:hypothetical protein
LNHHCLLHICIYNICRFELLVCCAYVTDHNATHSWETRDFNCSVSDTQISVALDLKKIGGITSVPSIVYFSRSWHLIWHLWFFLWFQI